MDRNVKKLIKKPKNLIKKCILCKYSITKFLYMYKEKHIAPTHRYFPT